MQSALQGEREVLRSKMDDFVSQGTKSDHKTELVLKNTNTQGGKKARMKRKMCQEEVEDI